MAFHWSTQRSYWMFKDVEDLKRLRVAAIADAHARISRAKSDMPADSFLTLNEEVRCEGSVISRCRLQLCC